MKKYYVIYKITNLINDKIYIGAHITNNVNDSYLGSGTTIINAVKKYGSINFKKEIIFFLDDKEKMYDKEKEIVNEEFVKRRDNYNNKIGGIGGWDHIDSSGENNPMKNPVTAKKVGVSLSKTLNEKLQNDEEYAIKFREKSRKGGLTHIGRKDSEETKAKRTASLKATIMNYPKKYKLIHKDKTKTLHSTMSEICEVYQLSRNVLTKWLNKGIIEKTKTATRVSTEGYNCYGYSIELIKNNIEFEGDK
jgi:hypothetical protein